MAGSRIAPELIAAYRATDYWVGSGERAFALRIDQPSAELAQLFAERGVACAACITACNPFSVPQPEAVNAAAQQALLRELASLSVDVIEGVGRGCDGKVEEQSVLALGLALEAAKRIGAGFRQNAIVWAGTDAVPTLVLLR